MSIDIEVSNPKVFCHEVYAGMEVAELKKMVDAKCIIETLPDQIESTLPKLGVAT